MSANIQYCSIREFGGRKVETFFLMLQGHVAVSQNMLRLGLGLGQAFTASALGVLICIPDASLGLFLSHLDFFPSASKFICCLICPSAAQVFEWQIISASPHMRIE